MGPGSVDTAEALRSLGVPRSRSLRQRTIGRRWPKGVRVKGTSGGFEAGRVHARSGGNALADGNRPQLLWRKPGVAGRRRWTRSWWGFGHTTRALTRARVATKCSEVRWDRGWGNKRPPSSTSPPKRLQRREPGVIAACGTRSDVGRDEGTLFENEIVSCMHRSKRPGCCRFAPTRSGQRDDGKHRVASPRGAGNLAHNGPHRSR